jgi:hypothetical protein
LKFGFSEATARTNHFAHTTTDHFPNNVTDIALGEFDNAVRALRSRDINVWVYQDENGQSPDVIFPNNWFTTHPGGIFITYPMKHTIRRQERSNDFVKWFGDRYDISDHMRYEFKEEEGLYLEGTGSLVFDHLGKTVYASRSQRTSETLAMEIAEVLGYEPVIFNACDKEGFPIYHTNVVLSVGFNLAIWCPEVIESDRQRDLILHKLQFRGRSILEMSFEQLERFACNTLELSNKNGDSCLVISRTAFESYSDEQIKVLNAMTNPIIVNIPTIEYIGGGSIRCMLAEVFS